jgi:SAM-dependent methyltransferase
MDYGPLDFDSLAEEYDAWFEEEGKLIFDIEVEALRKVLPALPKPWLEVGVGSGRFAQALGIDTGIDPSAKLLTMAKNRSIEVYQAIGEDRLFNKESYGTVFIIVTLCFVQSPVEVLYEIHRILNDEGKVVLGLVLRDSFWGQFYLRKKESGHRFYKHATFYSYEEISNLLDQTGFSIIQVVSTLFQKPNELEGMEVPRLGYFPEAGFSIVVANKA